MTILRTMMPAASALAAMTALTTAPLAAPHTPKESYIAVNEALVAPDRADQAGDDARRHPGDLIAFAGVGPGDVVIDYLPGSGYWTRIFTRVVGPRGHVYALWPAIAAPFATKALPALQARGLANVSTEVQTTNLPTAPRPVDVFWNVQYYHDIPNKGAGEPALRAFNAAVFRMLKPGAPML
jgi:predicted methyltransferase